MLYAIIPPPWLKAKGASPIQTDCSYEDAMAFNEEGYNVYYYPNYPKNVADPNKFLVGDEIDVFEWVFVDFDLKDGKYPDNEAFLEAAMLKAPPPSRIVDSGNGLHVYWRVSDLDAMSFLRLTRRLYRLLDTDPAVAKIKQLLRVTPSANTKIEGAYKPCEELYLGPEIYTCEEMDLALPPLIAEDETYCQQHYDKTYNISTADTRVSAKIPHKFNELIRISREAKDIWSGNVEDRSVADFRLGHIMHANGFTKEEARTVLANGAKASYRAPTHQIGYANGIIDKIWGDEAESTAVAPLSYSVADILSSKSSEELKGKRFSTYRYFDGTDHGFRLTQVVGLCAGVGVGKTAIALNLFKGFVEQNPDYVHMFVSLEQPDREIADRWRKMNADNDRNHTKVHVLSNYGPDGSYRNLSLNEIKEYILNFKKTTGSDVGCVCIDHIGILRQESKKGEYQGLRDVCSELKAFAVSTNTLLIIQSQTNRDKAGIGDLELFKDAAFGSQNFEGFVDFLMVAWQPLKRCYGNEACPRVTAYKFAKIRFKSKKDTLIEDQCYRLIFEDETGILRELTQREDTNFDHFANQALALRKKDRKTDLVTYTSVRFDEGGKDGKAGNNQDSSGTKQP